MGKILSITNQKGGVGKTTTAVNLCASLANRGKKVLLCDCDPQGNATSGMGIDKNSITSIYDVMLRSVEISKAIIFTKYGDVIGANKELVAANVEIVDLDDREYILKKALEPLRDSYDYIILDCPPSLELLTVNTLCASDGVIVPVQCEYFALEGLGDLTNTISIINQRLNPQLKLEGIVLTMYDSRTKLSEEVANELRSHFGDKVYKTQIPRNIRLSEAPSYGKPCIAYDRISKGTRAYLHLANEILKAQ